VTFNSILSSFLKPVRRSEHQHEIFFYGGFHFFHWHSTTYGALGGEVDTGGVIFLFSFLVPFSFLICLAFLKFIFPYSGSLNELDYGFFFSFPSFKLTGIFAFAQRFTISPLLTCTGFLKSWAFVLFYAFLDSPFTPNPCPTATSFSCQRPEQSLTSSHVHTTCIIEIFPLFFPLLLQQQSLPNKFFFFFYLFSLLNGVFPVLL